MNHRVKTSLSEKRFKSPARGKLLHRLGQITIGGRLGQQAPKKGQQTVEIELITGPKQGMQGFGEFQHHQLSTRPQNPAQFT